MNIALCDGSVRFIKDTVNSWSVNATASPPLPNGITYNTTTDTYIIGPGTQFGVWQQLSTRSFGEIISADAL